MQITPSRNNICSRFMSFPINWIGVLLSIFLIFDGAGSQAQAQGQTIDIEITSKEAITPGFSKPAELPSDQDPELMRDFEDAKKVSKQGHWSEAVRVWSELLPKVKQKHGQHHPLFLISSFYLGQAYRGSDQAKLALPILESVRQERTTIDQKKNSFDALLLEELSLIYAQLADHQKLIEVDLKLLTVKEESLGAEAPGTVNVMERLAMSYHTLGLFQKALPLRLKVLEIIEKHLGPDHKRTSHCLNNLSLTYSALARYDKALPLQLRALDIREKVLGPVHPDTSLSLINLALTYSALAQHDKALPLLQRALDIDENTVGPDHPDTATSLNNLAETYGNLAQYDKALPLQKRALAIYEKALGPEHPYTATSLNNLAITNNELGQFDKSLPLLRRSLDINERAIGPDHPDTATSLNNLALAYRGLAQYDKALPLQQRALVIREKALGPWHPDTATSLNNLAFTYSELGQFDQALPLQQRALVISEKALGPWHPDTATSLNNLALTYSALGQHDKAVPLQQRALAINEKVHGPTHPDTASILSNLAYTYNKLAQYEKTLPLQQRALNIREHALGPEHPDTSLTLNNLALTYSALGQFDKALPLQQRALAITVRALGSEHPYTAMNLDNLADTYSKIGQHDMALPLQQRALAIREKVLGPEHPDTARSLDNLADTYNKLAQYEKTLPLQQRALNIREYALGAEHPDTSLTLNNLAQTYSALGQFDKALPLQQRALAITEKALGPEHPDTATNLENLADIYNKIGQHDRALPLQQRALAIREKVLGPEHPDTAGSLSNLAITHNALNQYDKSLPLLQRALVIDETSIGPDHPHTATTLNNLAVTYVELAQYDKVLPLQQRALAINEKAFGLTHPSTATSLHNLALTVNRLGQPELGIVFLKSSVNTYQSQREQVSKIDASTLSSYTESVTDSYQTLAALLVDQGQLAEAQLVLDMLKENEQFEFIRRSANPDSRLTRIGYNNAEKFWLTRYRQIADRLVMLGVEERTIQKQAKLGLSAAQKQRQKDLATDMRVAQKAFESFLAEMRESFAAKGPARAVEATETSEKAVSDLKALILSLGEGVALLQYYVTDDQVGMLLTTTGVQLARSFRIGSKDLNRNVAEFRRALRDPKVDSLPMAKALYKVLLAPVESDLMQAGAKTVMLSLDGALRYLPFGALHDGQQYATQRWGLPIYTSVVREKLRDTASANWQAAGLGVTRAMGEFSALPSVSAEMGSIVKTKNNSGVLPGEIYLDEAFSALRLKDVGHRKFELLHVASHFRFSPGTEANSFLLLGDGQQLTLGDIRTQNYRFDNVDLLTLSACDTGLGGGRDAKGKEIEGFGVIAQQQGAKAVLATLWPVADQSTASLMADMYRRRQAQGLSKIEALRQAQMALMQQPKYAHPFYWAPFILMGNWK